MAQRNHDWPLGIVALSFGSAVTPLIPGTETNTWNDTWSKPFTGCHTWLSTRIARVSDTCEPVHCAVAVSRSCVPSKPGHSQHVLLKDFKQ